VWDSLDLVQTAINKSFAFEGVVSTEEARCQSQKKAFEWDNMSQSERYRI
jgi:hypothetical protein